MDLPPYLGANNMWKYLCEFFSTQYKLRIKLHKISEKFSRNSFFLKFRVKISTEFGTKRDKFQVKRMSIHLGKKSNSFAHKEPSFQPWQWWIKNLLQILWDDLRDQISAKSQ